MKDSKYFKTRTMASGVTLIEGVAGEYCYLVEGTDRALLIDTLTGIGNLKEYCAELTELPLLVANTHGHFDHSGGNFVFGEVFIHPADIPLMYQNCTAWERNRFAANIVCQNGFKPNWGREDVAPMGRLICHPISEGDRFDLGGRILEAVATPGHTKGSVCFLDRLNRHLFAGDTCNTNTLIYLDGSTTIAEYLVSLEKLKSLQDYFDAYFICHEDTPIDKSCIDDAILCCRDILSGNDDAQPGENLGKPCYYAKTRNSQNRRADGRIGNVAYIKEKRFIAP